jgi:hypothetical protein
MYVWSFWVHNGVFPFILLSYCYFTCINSGFNIILLYVSIIISYFDKRVLCYKVMYFKWYSFFGMIINVLPLSAFVIIRLLSSNFLCKFRLTFFSIDANFVMCVLCVLLRVSLSINLRKPCATLYLIYE